MLSLSHTQNALHPRGIAQLLSCLVDLESHGRPFFNAADSAFISHQRFQPHLDTVCAVSCLQGSTLPLLNKIGLLTVITGGTEVYV